MILLRGCIVGFALHFLLLLGISCRETLALIANGYTNLPSSVLPAAQRGQEAFATVTGQNLLLGHPLHDLVASYSHLAGIELGYGYFAPNVPDAYKLIFELHYADGHSENEVAGLTRAEGNLRLSSYLDQIGGTTSPGLREMMIKLLAASIWREHPDVVLVRAVLGQLILPTPAEFVAGGTEHYEFLNAYDFTLAPAD